MHENNFFWTFLFCIVFVLKFTFSYYARIVIYFLFSFKRFRCVKNYRSPLFSFSDTGFIPLKYSRRFCIKWRMNRYYFVIRRTYKSTYLHRHRMSYWKRVERLRCKNTVTENIAKYEIYDLLKKRMCNITIYLIKTNDFLSTLCSCSYSKFKKYI